MLSVAHCVIFASVVLGILGADDELQARANAYIDDFIAKATNGSGGFIDPLELEELSKVFEREIAFVRVKGEAKLYDGKIYGLSSLQRKGNAVVIDLDDMIMISTQLTFKKIHATYRGALLLNDAGPRVTLNAKIGGSKVSMFIVVPAEGGKGDLMSFNINSLQDIRISIWGLGPFGWSASILSTLALNALEKPVAKAASLKIFEHFSKELDKIPFPGKDVVTTGEDVVSTVEEDVATTVEDVVTTVEDVVTTVEDVVTTVEEDVTPVAEF